MFGQIAASEGNGSSWKSRRLWVIERRMPKLVTRDSTVSSHGRSSLNGVIIRTVT